MNKLALILIYIMTIYNAKADLAGHEKGIHENQIQQQVSVSNNVDDKWWLTASPIVRIQLVRDQRTVKDYTNELPKLAQAGIKIIDLYAPYHGGVQYGGLDPIDYFSPRSGSTFEDIRNFIKTAHSLGMKVVSFINLGYSATNYPDWIKACNDMKNGVQSRERDMFVWSDKSNQNRSLERPFAPWFQQDNSNDGGWVFSEEAGKYFYARWWGAGGNVKLPQFQFASQVWQDECVRIIRFWRDIGFDGFIVDAVNWYTGCDWTINYNAIIKPAFENGELFMQPEGGGGNGDDPVYWMTMGKYSCVQDYSLNASWSNTDVIGDCFNSGEASALWPILETYRNRVVAVGGVTYLGLGSGRNFRRTNEHLKFEAALLVAIGEMIALNLRSWENMENSAEFTKVFNLQNSHAALAPAGKRKLIKTDGMPASIYAVQCIDEKSGKNIDAIFNFGTTAYTYNVAGRSVTVASMKYAFVLSSNGEVIYQTF